ncbi:MAG: class I SAM-dependent methyltransferase [Candidatus Nanopelagicales bacterium]
MTDFDAAARDWDDQPGHLERAQALAAAIRAVVPLEPAWVALEYGAGTGLLGRSLCAELGHITLADASAGMVAQARLKVEQAEMGARLSAIQLDLVSDPAPSERFDLILASAVLHHVPDVPALLRAFRALQKVGAWIALADLDAEDGSFHGPDFTGHRGLDRAELGAQIAAAGYEQVSFRTAYRARHGHGERSYPVFLATAQAAAETDS